MCVHRPTTERARAQKRPARGLWSCCTPPARETTVSPPEQPRYSYLCILVSMPTVMKFMLMCKLSGVLLLLLSTQASIWCMWASMQA